MPRRHLTVNRTSSDQRSSKAGLRKILVLLMMVCSVVYIAGAIKNQHHFFQIDSDRVSQDQELLVDAHLLRPTSSEFPKETVDDGQPSRIDTNENEPDGYSRMDEPHHKNDTQMQHDLEERSTDDEPTSGQKNVTVRPMTDEQPEVVGDQDKDMISSDEEDNMRNDPDSTSMVSQGVRNHTLVPFVKQDGVVIVTKIHGPHQLIFLEQSLCLLHYAYNRRPLYDILVFTTLPVSDAEAQPLQTMVQPAKLSFVVDNRGIQEEITALSPERRANFLKSCNVTDPSNVTWWSDCPNRIAYNWQAEFRSWHIWRHEALRPYRWMMWLDADGFCTEEWKVDPIQVMIENDLVILFDNWPKGRHKGRDVQDRIWEAFGVHICRIKLGRSGFQSYLSNTTDGCKRGRVADIHGFFHITVGHSWWCSSQQLGLCDSLYSGLVQFSEILNLDFYRTDTVQKWARTWIGDGFLQRRYDDQGAVTVPAAIMAPNRSWDMRRNDIQLNVYHNFHLDGKKLEGVGGFRKYWRKVVQHQLPDAAKVCKISNAG